MNINNRCSINAAWLTARARCGLLWKTRTAIAGLATIHVPFPMKRGSALDYCEQITHT